MLTGLFTGGSTIVSLQLQWDMGTSGTQWSTLLGFSPFTTSTVYTITGDVVKSARIYKFRYRAYNIHGWGPYSEALDLLAASIPDSLDSVVTNLIGTQVQISWIPLNENGSPLDQYKIEFKTAVGTYVQLMDGCDGTDANVKANNYCIFPISIFMQSPLSLL